MQSDDFERLETADLLDQALALVDSSADDDARWEAVVALRRRPERAVFERATGWCASPVPSHRCLGADVLAQLGAPKCPYAAESTAVLLHLLEDGNEDVIVEALYALGHLRVGSATDLAAFARHASARVREAVAHALGGRDDPAALDALTLLIADADTDVRNWAAFSLGSLCRADTPEVRDALAARLDDEDGEVRGEALVGLARRRDPRAVAAITAELCADTVSSLAVEAAETMPSPEFVGPLRVLARSAPDNNVLRALERCEATADS
jgi:HEAT repeat protein